MSNRELERGRRENYWAEVAMADAGSSATAVMRPGATASGIELDVMKSSASEAVEFLRGIANPHRLMILCHLARGEHSVGTLERELGIRQAHLSQQLARLRQDGLVQTRRDSRTIYYSIGTEAATEVIALLYRLFCAGGSRPEGSE
jgi:DNA-binding transcriptional ArsR family regulator